MLLRIGKALGWTIAVLSGLVKILEYCGVDLRQSTAFVRAHWTHGFGLGLLFVVLGHWPKVARLAKTLRERVRASLLRRLARPLAWLPGSPDCRVRLNEPPWREIWWPDSAKSGVFSRVDMILMLIPSPSDPDGPVFAGIEISTSTDGRIVFYIGSDGLARVFETSVNPLTFKMDTPVREWHTLRLVKSDDTYSAFVNGQLVRQGDLRSPDHRTNAMTDLWPEEATVKARANTDSPTSQVAVLTLDVGSTELGPDSSAGADIGPNITYKRFDLG